MTTYKKINIINNINNKNLQLMNNLIGKDAPHFTAQAVMPDNKIAELSLKNYIGQKNILLFFYPLNFTFVCPTEIIALNNRIIKFHDLDTEVFGISIDSQFSHLAWRNTEIHNGGIGKIQLPLISDINKTISTEYQALAENGIANRVTVIINKQGVILYHSQQFPPIGRNIDEIIRIIEAIKFYETSGEVCPAGWQKGHDGITASEEGIADYLTSNSTKL